MKNIKLYIYITIEIILLILAWITFMNLGSLQLLVREVSIVNDALETINRLYLLLAVLVFVPFITLLYCIFWETHLILKEKNAKQEKSDQSISELLTNTEEKSEEQILEEEKRAQEKLRKTKEQLYKCFDDEIGKIDSTNHKLVSEKILSCISRFYEITQAEIFLRRGSEKESEEDKLTLSATYAFFIPDEKVFEFSMGEGLIGQVAKAGNSLYLDNIPEGYITVKSGLGTATPSHLLICPWKDNENNTFAIIEIASFKELTKNDVKLFEEISEKVAQYYSFNKK